MQPNRSTALYVDFDNIYLGLLNNRGVEYASVFATNPAAWLGWLTRQSSPFPADQQSLLQIVKGLLGQRRTITPEKLTTQLRHLVIRRCYINPTRLQKHRYAFVRAGFDVIDCPSLTGPGQERRRYPHGAGHDGRAAIPRSGD